MPAVIFFSSVLVAVMLSLTTVRMVEDAQTSLWPLQHTAARLSAESMNSVNWSDARPSFALEAVQAMRASEESKRFNEEISFQQGVVPDVLGHQFSISEPGFPSLLYKPSIELRLFDVGPDEMIDALIVEACDDDCPELFVEWFRFDRSFRLQQLSQINTYSKDLEVTDGCLDLVDLGVRRCLYRSSQHSFPFELDEIMSPNGLKKAYRLQLSLASYHYIVRLRSENRSPIALRVGAEKAGELVAVPQQVLGSYAQSQFGSSSEMVHEQRQWYAGLFPGLEFVHFAHEVETK